MSGGPSPNLGVAAALRRAGYVKIPAWWVTPDQLEVIHRMAHGNQGEINRIRKEARDARRNSPVEEAPRDTPAAGHQNEAGGREDQGHR